MDHLITAEDITERTVAQPNSDKHKLTLAIPVAEGGRLRPVLGAGLYAELILGIQIQPMAEENLAKLATCEPLMNMLSNWALYEAWPTLLVHVTEAGVVVKNGKEVSTSADAATADKTRLAIADTAEFWTGELRAWLYEHRAEYPSYVPPTCAAVSSMPLGGVQF